jgi:hypothetical protein
MPVMIDGMFSAYFPYKTEIMSFRVGQKVLCVNDHYHSYCRYPVKKGSVYTIHGFYRCSCGSLQVTLVEFPGETLMHCRCPLVSERRQSYYIWRFIPLEYFEKFIGFSTEKQEDRKEKEPHPWELKEEESLKFQEGC